MEKLNRKLFAELIDVRSSIYDELVSAEIITVGNDELSSVKKSEVMEYAHNQALETLDSFISKYETFLLESEAKTWMKK